MPENIIIELTESEVDTLKDSLRWTREHCEEKGLRRVKNQVKRLEKTVDGQVDR